LSPEKAADPVRRSFSAQAMLSLEYWIGDDEEKMQ
jgi:hypothetical protein